MEGGIVPEYPREDQAFEHDLWHWYIGLIFGRAAVIAFTGFLVAIAVVVRACCRHDPKQFAQVTWRPVLWLTGLVLVLAALGAVCHAALAAPGLALAAEALAGAHEDASAAVAEGDTLARLGRELAALFNPDDIPCEEVATLYGAIAVIQPPIERFQADVSGGILANLAWARLMLASGRGAAATAASVPGACALLAAAAALAAVLRSWRPADTSLAKCRCRCRAQRWGPVLFAPCIVVACCSAAFGMVAALTSASLCRDPAANSLNYLVHRGGAAMRSLNRPLISGTPGNPYLDHLARIRGQFGDISLSANASLANPACASIKGLPGGAALAAAAAPPLAAAGELMRSERFHAHYMSAVEEGTCRMLAPGLAWIVVLQASAGLLVLPALATAVDSYCDSSGSFIAEAGRTLELVSPPGTP